MVEVHYVRGKYTDVSHWSVGSGWLSVRGIRVRVSSARITRSARVCRHCFTIIRAVKVHKQQGAVLYSEPQFK